MIDEASRTNEDRAGKEYWEATWGESSLPPPFDPSAPGLSNFYARGLHKYFSEIFGGRRTENSQLLEIGCGNSALLPYFSQQFGFCVSGLDYSPSGCHAANRMLERENVPGKIYLGDLAQPPEELLGSFDVTFSAGVVEHFNDTAQCLYRCSRFLKPGGMLVTIIPNLKGLVGTLQKILNRTVYDIHIPLSQEDLTRAAQRAGLTVARSDYLVALSLNVVNVESWGNKFRYKCYRGLGHVLSVGASLIEEKTAFIRPNAWSSPWICNVALRRDNGNGMQSLPDGLKR